MCLKVGYPQVHGEYWGMIIFHDEIKYHFEVSPQFQADVDVSQNTQGSSSQALLGLKLKPAQGRETVAGRTDFRIRKGGKMKQ